MIDFYSVGLSLGSAVIVALLTRYFQNSDFERLSRQADFVAFANAVAEMSQADHGSPERKVTTGKMIASKSSIILHASRSVIDALHRQQQHKIIADDQSKTDFVRLLAAMRKDLGGGYVPEFEAKVKSILFEG